MKNLATATADTAEDAAADAAADINIRNTQEPVAVSNVHPAIIFIEESVDDMRY